MRKFITSTLAGLAIGTVLSLAPASFTTPASAQYRHYDQGGVVPCSADDYSFRGGRWVSNCRGGHGMRRGGQRGGGYQQQQGHQTHGVRTRTVTTVRTGSFQVKTGNVAVKTGTMLVNRRTGEQIFIPVR